MCAVHAQYNQNLSELYVTPRALLRAEASIFNADPTDWFAVKLMFTAYVRLSSAVTGWRSSDHSNLLVHSVPAAP